MTNELTPAQQREKDQRQTFIALSVLGIAAAAWEIWTILNPRKADTFSAVLKQLGTNQPFIVFACGLLSGHLWWPLKDGED
jgi:hypothetical protein